MKWIPSLGRMRGDLAPVGQELTGLSAAMTAWRDTQHDEDGGHTDITAETYTGTGLTSFGGPWQIPEDAILTPPQIVASQNNYNPPGLADRIVVRVTTDASRAITGIVTDPRYERWLWIINAGNFDFTIPHNSASSFALYRIACPLGTTLTVSSGAVICLYYDTHAGNWRVVGGSGTITGLLTGGVTDGDKGDITVSSSGAVFTIDNDVVTYAKMQNVSAASKLLGRGDSGSGDPQEITLGTGLSMSGTTLNGTSGTRTTTIGILIDGGSSTITTGVKGFIRIPVTCTLTGWTLLSVDAAATSGSIVIDVWKDVFANYPPTNADSITNGHEPTLTTAAFVEDTNISDWTSVAVTAGDVIGFNVDSVTTLTRALLEITATVP